MRGGGSQRLQFTLHAQRPCTCAIWIAEWAALFTGAGKPSKGACKERSRGDRPATNWFQYNPLPCVTSPSHPQGHCLRLQAYFMLLLASEPLHTLFPLPGGRSSLSHHCDYGLCLSLLLQVAAHTVTVPSLSQQPCLLSCHHPMARPLSPLQCQAYSRCPMRSVR